MNVHVFNDHFDSIHGNIHIYNLLFCNQVDKRMNIHKYDDWKIDIVSYSTNSQDHMEFETTSKWLLMHRSSLYDLTRFQRYDK